jgi:hypothetical protein
MNTEKLSLALLGRITIIAIQNNLDTIRNEACKLERSQQHTIQCLISETQLDMGYAHL